MSNRKAAHTDHRPAIVILNQIERGSSPLEVLISSMLTHSHAVQDGGYQILCAVWKGEIELSSLLYLLTVVIQEQLTLDTIASDTMDTIPTNQEMEIKEKRLRYL